MSLPGHYSATCVFHLCESIDAWVCFSYKETFFLPIKLPKNKMCFLLELGSTYRGWNILELMYYKKVG